MPWRFVFAIIKLRSAELATTRVGSIYGYEFGKVLCTKQYTWIRIVSDKNIRFQTVSLKKFWKVPVIIYSRNKFVQFLATQTGLVIVPKPID